MKKKRPDKVRITFKASISLASRCGFVHHAALASKRAGQYFLQQKDIYWTEHHLTNSHQLYADWDAAAKVRQMERTYQSLVASDELKAGSWSSFSDTPPLLMRQPSVSLTRRSRLGVVVQVEATKASRMEGHQREACHDRFGDLCPCDLQLFEPQMRSFDLPNLSAAPLMESS